jgi:hypothetical protein
VNADKVEQPLFDHRHILTGIIKKFAYGNRRAGLLTENPQVFDVLWSEYVLQKEKAVFLQLLGERDGLNGRYALVNVVEQFDIIAQMGPQMVGVGSKVRCFGKMGAQIFSLGVSPRAPYVEYPGTATWARM